MIVKVCGMRDAGNIREVEALGVDWMGFIFWEHSSRYVSQRPSYLPAKAKRVGVFVDAPIEIIRQKAGDYRLDFIQLHGHEHPDFLRQLRDYPLIKAFNIASEEDLEQTRAYEGLAACYLFDTKAQQPGGSGLHFDWNVLRAYDGQTPFLLSGGIGPGDAAKVRAFRHPRFAGIDLNSRFELRPALKNIQLLKDFLHEQD